MKLKRPPSIIFPHLSYIISSSTHELVNRFPSQVVNLSIHLLISFSIFRLPKSEILSGHFEVIVVVFDVGDALGFEKREAFGMTNDVFQFSIDIGLTGQNINDGSQFFLAQDVVVFRFATAYADDTFRHGQQRIHRRRVAIELVEDEIAAVHQVLVLDKGDRLGLHQFYFFGVSADNPFGSGKQYVGAFVGVTLLIDTDEDSYFPFRLKNG